MSVGIGRSQLAHNKPIPGAPSLTRSWAYVSEQQTAAGSFVTFGCNSSSGFINGGNVAQTTANPCANIIQASGQFGWFFSASSTNGFSYPVDSSPTCIFKAWVINIATGAGNDAHLVLMCTDTGNPNNGTNAVALGNKIGFYCLPGVGNWKAFVTVAGSKTEVDTGVSAAAFNVAHVFKFVSSFNTGTVRFFIDGVQVALISAMPASGVVFARVGAYGYFNTTTSGANTGQGGVAWMYTEFY